jgi:hypothetical protein
MSFTRATMGRSYLLTTGTKTNIVAVVANSSCQNFLLFLRASYHRSGCRNVLNVLKLIQNYRTDDNIDFDDNNFKTKEGYIRNFLHRLDKPQRYACKTKMKAGTIIEKRTGTLIPNEIRDGSPKVLTYNKKLTSYRKILPKPKSKTNYI